MTLAQVRWRNILPSQRVKVTKVRCLIVRTGTHFRHHTHEAPYLKSKEDPRQPASVWAGTQGRRGLPSHEELAGRSGCLLTARCGSARSQALSGDAGAAPRHPRALAASIPGLAAPSRRLRPPPGAHAHCAAARPSAPAPQPAFTTQEARYCAGAPGPPERAPWRRAASQEAPCCRGAPPPAGALCGRAGVMGC